VHNKEIHNLYYSLNVGRVVNRVTQFICTYFMSSYVILCGKTGATWWTMNTNEKQN
jgi:hypothetical protein